MLGRFVLQNGGKMLVSMKNNIEKVFIGFELK